MGEGTGDEHVSVLVDEVVGHLQPTPGRIYVDGTLGLGGHAQRILEATAPDGRVIGFDWDEEAIAVARRRLASFGDRLRIVRANYADLVAGLAGEGVMAVHGLVLDLGVSSLQLDRAGRGFSFQADAPLDMRMDLRLRETAAQLIARLSAEELADLFYNFGEERQSRRIAARLVEARKSQPVTTTRQLAEIVARAIPRRFHPPKMHVATRVFQALRIAVNRELNNLVKVLAEAPTVLVPGARMCVLTFHSLEDRIVKQAFAGSRDYKVVTRKPVLPGRQEVLVNPRARSAKLRVAERV
ncbi:MAG TPA: 16S rRNA (cytosine(1402)-N(4))-methyltransferase [Desulfobulbaceae bacterium]|nr:16S rRNA (cytosine(1402)-N(4))-methyltransferase [Desulfobulbaceae bacterium]